MSAGEWFAALLMIGVCALIAIGCIRHDEGKETQPAIQTVIVTVRVCDVIHHIQGDKLIAAHNAADQPKSCKVQMVKP